MNQLDSNDLTRGFLDVLFLLSVVGLVFHNNNKNTIIRSIHLPSNGCRFATDVSRCKIIITPLRHYVPDAGLYKKPLPLHLQRTCHILQGVPFRCQVCPACHYIIQMTSYMMAKPITRFIDAHFNPKVFGCA